MKTRETIVAQYEALMDARIKAKDGSPELTAAIAEMNQWLISNGTEFDMYIKKQERSA